MTTSGLRIGYSFWGFLGDTKHAPVTGDEVSSPDGNATYSWALVHRAVERGHTVVPLMPDRDRIAFNVMGPELFASFNKDARAKAYSHLRANRLMFNDTASMKLDAVLLEWRWPIPGRNCAGPLGLQYDSPDLDLQESFLCRYLDQGVPTIIWDLDHKLNDSDVTALKARGPVDFIETSIHPKPWARRVNPPTVEELLLEIDSRSAHGHAAAYVGNRYERDDEIDKWIEPLAVKMAVDDDRFLQTVLVGKGWFDSDALLRWPTVSRMERVSTRGLVDLYSSAGIVPLLAKQSYRESGFMTPRNVEAVMFGALPVGLNGHAAKRSGVWRVAYSLDELYELAGQAVSMSKTERSIARVEVAHQLARWDAAFFWATVELCINAAS